MSTTEVTEPYAICNDCSVVLMTFEDTTRHHLDTMSPTGESDYATARSHSTRAANPSPEAKRERLVESEVMDALDDFMLRLESSVSEGLTEDEITGALRRVDLNDAWSDWLGSR